jgi:hypothetical protein
LDAVLHARRISLCCKNPHRPRYRYPNLITQYRASGGGGMMLHLYMYAERDMVEESIRLAEATGAFSAIILTCDHPHGDEFS